MQQLWAWVATDRFGKATKYQAFGPGVTEAEMRDCLVKHFPGVTLTGIERLEDGQYLPATGPIQSHAFSLGHYDKWLRANGLTPSVDAQARQNILIPRNVVDRATINRATIVRRPFIESLNRR